MRAILSRSPRSSRGFSLVEVMVSMVIALLTFLVMLQMFQSWDRSKRTTAAGGGAMVSGAVGMYRLERDLRLAGFGLFGSPDFGCDVEAYDGDRPVPQYSFPLRAIRIVDGAGGLPDRIEVLYGSSEGVANQGFATVSAGGQPYTGRATDETTEMDIGALGGFRQGDLAIIASDPDDNRITTNSECRLVEITSTVQGDRRTFAHVNAQYANAYTGVANQAARYNRPGGPVDVGDLGQTGRVYGLGPRPQRRVWQIRDNRVLAFVNDLAWLDVDADTANDITEIADNVIDLQAQYGVAATPGTAAETQCIQADPNPWWTVTDPSLRNGNPTGTDPINCLEFIWAIRIGVLVRSDEFEKTWGVAADAGGSAVSPAWTVGAFTMRNVDGTADSFAASTQANPSRDPNDWRHYRYKVFEAVVPLKNVFWGSRT